MATPSTTATNEPAAPRTRPLTKVELIKTLTETTGVERKTVTLVLAGIEDLVRAELNGVGVITLPGLFKVHRKVKPARSERQAINPFTKEPITIAAKAASAVIKVNPVKALKDVVATPVAS